MRSTPKIRVSPLATRPYTPPSRRPLTTACRRRPQVTSVRQYERRRFSPRRLSLPLGHREDRLRLGVLRRPDDGWLAALDLDQGRGGVDVLAAVVELDRLLGQDVIGEVGLRDRVPHLFP